MPAGQPFTLLCRQMARPRFAGRADLHVHTNYSDGDYTAAQVVDLAQRAGLAAVAITDHDTTTGIAPARQAACHRSPVEIIAGIEITAEFRGRELHLLGYFFRPDDGPLQSALAALRADRLSRFGEMVGRLKQLGVFLPDELLAGVSSAGTLGRRNLAELLVRAHKATTIREAFQRFLGDHGRAAVPKRRLAVREAIALVRGAGGVAAWAHPTYDCTERALAELCTRGLQAVEADFPSCRPSRARDLRTWADKLGLAITGGSDCHGPEPAGRHLGTHGVTPAELEALRGLAGAGASGALEIRNPNLEIRNKSEYQKLEADR
jgi:predicted metal-dependent phosphoesterase TrpH